MNTHHRLLAHFRSGDPVMHELAVTHGPCPLLLPAEKDDAFSSLVGAIIGQQLSVKAAATILQRTVFCVGELTPARVLAADATQLREAGLSRSKVRYLQELARHIIEGKLEHEAFPDMDNADILKALVRVPGIGQWTAEMFLIFHLRRLDVFSPGDGGLQRAIRNLYGETADALALAEKWRPYRSVACWYLWRSLDNAPVI